MYPISSRYDIVLGPPDGQQGSRPKSAKSTKKTSSELPAVDPTRKDSRGRGSSSKA